MLRLDFNAGYNMDGNMVVIKNTQRKIKINTVQFEHDAYTVLKELGYEGYDLGVWFTTNQTIKKFNGQYRDKNVPTDILSFPYHDLKPGEKIKPQTDDDKNLGDLIISAEFVYNLYPGDLFYPRLQKLLVHGASHLLGYDHYTPEADVKMLKLEERLLKAIK